MRRVAGGRVGRQANFVEARMGQDTASLLRELRGATKGLTFQSESDYPVKPFAQRAKDKDTPSAQDFVASKKTDAAATVSEVDLDKFFGGAAQVEDWQSPEAQRNAKKFQALIEKLKTALTDIKVYKVGDAEADVYVVGKTASGDLAGVTTKVVET
jgi:hypothetical protein